MNRRDDPDIPYGDIDLVALRIRIKEANFTGAFIFRCERGEIVFAKLEQNVQQKDLYKLVDML